ncbi:hypothetical protein FD13_GL000183 [Levilactobacillus senmaizukei DSM 21775 = NBRC 103853]|uniref:Zinc-ribbon domain-containing protein n=1 Tax=Levilactobacillus senmaizukei DSM 21775 = NBRC 103853 TaxID=1423803 RepID=A0A0R2DIX5_9LACO|nr:zinc ribbon domain-containing protein [Levilactobacillus senmaizukei]KRN03395.1 hypothetical protein FD13_GL000183 [Levilactobacillus senmaizukei DSM 21775 = NBRC 103853]
MNLKFCPQCGEPVSPNDDQCPHCQFDLQAVRQSTSAPKTQAKKFNLGSLYANPYREGMKRLHAEDAAAAKPRRHHWWPWSKE